MMPAIPTHSGRLRRFGAVNWLGLFTLTRRETSRGLKDYNYQILGPVVSSLLYLAVFHLAIRTVGGDNGSNADLLDFIAPGLIIFVACEKAFENACGSFIFDKHERVMADLLMAPLSSIERVCGYLAGACLAGFAVGLAVALITLFFAELSLVQPVALVFFAIMGAMMHGLIGILVGIWAEKWDSYAAVHTFLLLPLSFLSGLFYRVENLPTLAQELVRLNPVFYIIDGFRFGMTGTGSSNPWVGAVVLLLVNAGLFTLAHAWFRRGYRLKP
ncbi:ABC transporter permease [Dongia mobilis]|uniref:ABC transporter permease n=1 Tax=Dongia sp. TaxID=1977262 RepID=UPI0026F2C71C